MKKLVIALMLMITGLFVSSPLFASIPYDGSWYPYGTHSIWEDTQEAITWRYEFAGFTIGAYYMDVDLIELESLLDSDDTLGRLIAWIPNNDDFTWYRQPHVGARIEATATLYDESNNVLYRDILQSFQMVYVHTADQLIFESFYDADQPSGVYAFELEAMGNYEATTLTIRIPAIAPSIPSGNLDVLQDETSVSYRRAQNAIFWVGDDIYDIRPFYRGPTWPESTPPPDGAWEFVDWYFEFPSSLGQIRLYRSHGSPNTFPENRDIEFYARYRMLSDSGYVDRGSGDSPLPDVGFDLDYGTRLPSNLTAFLSSVGWHNFAGYMIIFTIVVVAIIVSLVMMKIQPLVILIVVGVVFAFFMFLGVIPAWAMVSLSSVWIALFIMIIRGG
jgi:hypothetical protein